MPDLGIFIIVVEITGSIYLTFDLLRRLLLIRPIPNENRITGFWISAGISLVVFMAVDI